MQALGVTSSPLDDCLKGHPGTLAGGDRVGRKGRSETMPERTSALGR
jgi:hypothetical protein